MRFPKCSRFLIVVAALLLSRALLAEDLSFPPAPASHVLDEAKVLQPEQIARLSAALLQAARDDDMQVYVATLYAVDKAKMAATGDAVTKAWTPGVVGAVLLFENQTGLVSIGTSTETDARFSELELNIVLRQPLMAGRKQGISPDKLEKAAYAVIEALHKLQSKARRERRWKWITNLGMLALLGVAGTIVWVSAANKRKPDAPAETPAAEPPPPTESAA